MSSAPAPAPAPTPNVPSSHSSRAPGDGGRGRGRRFNRRSGRGSGRGSVSPRPGSGSGSKFKGETSEMNGNVFECFSEQTDRRQFKKTMDVLDGYVKKHLKHAEDLSPIFASTMRVPEIEKPIDPGEDATKTDELIYHEEIKEYVKRKKQLGNSQAALHAVIWGQCSEQMRTKLKSLADFQSRVAANDCVYLLKQIKAITLQFDEKRNAFLSLIDAKTSFYGCKQSHHQTTDEYYEELKGWIDTIEYYGGTVSESYDLVSDGEEDDGAGSVQARSVSTKMAIARERTVAMALIKGADKARFGTLIADLSNQYAMGFDHYPTDLTSAYSLLSNYTTPANTSKPPKNPAPTVPAPQTTEELMSAMTFAQNALKGPPVPGKDGQLHDKIPCYNCNRNGHYSPECPEAAKTPGVSLMHIGVSLTQSPEYRIDNSWILLDSQSTVSVFNNPRFLSNIRPSNQVLRAITNGGHQDSNLIGDFPNLGEVWYNPASIANIISLAQARKVCRVTMDTASSPEMHLHRKDGSVMVFKETDSGLFVFKTQDSTSVTAYTFVSTVEERKKQFTRRQVTDADTARDLYRKLGRPSEADFKAILHNNLIRNCPVTVADAKRALLIYGPDLATLKGKMTHAPAPDRVTTQIPMPLPTYIGEYHSNITLCIDLFYVQGHPFHHTISRDFGFRTVAPIKSRGMPTLLLETKTAIEMYAARDLTVTSIIADGEFECIRASLRPIVFNIVPTDTHAAEVERSIKTVKERCRATAHGLPFRRLPKLLLNAIVSESVRCLNQFPWKHGISETLSPTQILTGCPPPDYATMKLELGQYVQVFEDNSPTNTLRSRSLGAIALGTTGNAHGDFHFLSLATGERITRHQWTEVPITDLAISRVEALAEREGQPLLQDGNLLFEWRPGHLVDGDAYDAPYDPVPHDDEPLAHDVDPIDDEELQDLLADVPNALPMHGPAPVVAAPGAAHEEHQNHNGDTNDENEDAQAPPIDEEEEEQEQALEEQEANENEEDDLVVHLPEHQEQTNENENDNDNHNDDNDGPEPNNVSTRPQRTIRPPRRLIEEDQLLQTANNQNKGAQPKHKEQGAHERSGEDDGLNYCLVNILEGASDEYIERFVMAFIMNQMTANKGIQKHGRKAEEALMREFEQFETLDVYEGVHPHTLTKEQKSGALRAINLIKEKRDGTIKGRTVADGSKQRHLYTKAETASPTVSAEALMASIVIDAFEQRDVGTSDVAGAYLNAHQVDFVIMKFSGKTVKLICDVNKKYIPFVVKENGVDVLYVRLKKALYGCVKSALLWYELFSKTLQQLGFELNPYDKCVANKMVNGKQCTIAWYVDDTKISHVDKDVVTDTIEKLESHFGKMTVTRGKEHTYLGMKIKYKDNGTATISMKDYLKESIVESGLNISRTCATPARKNLFDLDEKSPALPKERAEVFHSTVAKLLYVATRARMDILLPVSFLCTRVTKSTTEDEDKLKRVLEYINGTLDLEYTIGADSLHETRTWVDASFAVHPDMKSHTGGLISFGIGGILCKSSKQKLNTKSSTEAELVGASDYLPNTLWLKMFMEHQGYKITESFFEQDNESAIKLEKNGRTSAGPKSRHINIRYFFIKERTETEGIEIRHCPTGVMVADFFTKPLQGCLFKRFRDVILGYLPMSELEKIDPDDLNEERVGEEESDEPEYESSSTSGTHVNETKDVTTEAHLEANSKEVTWVDVVSRKKLRKDPEYDEKAKSVLRSLSQNNPVNGK